MSETVFNYDEIAAKLNELSDEKAQAQYLNGLGSEIKNAFLIEGYNRRTDNQQALNNLLANVNTRRQGYGKIWSTGYKNLDEHLGGGFLGGDLIFLGAISSLGKTSYVLQMATQIAELGDDVLVFSLEMSSDELNAKTISRYTHLLSVGSSFDAREDQNCRLTARDILTGDIGTFAIDQPVDRKAKLFQRAFDKTREVTGDRIKFYIGENNVSVEHVRKVVNYHLKATRKKPFVILDYLQILKPSKENLEHHLDKRLLTEDDCTKLKCLARDLGIPVLVISAFNRDSYLEPVSKSSFKETSGIEYSADYLIAMQYCHMDYVKKSFGDKGEVYETQPEHANRVRELVDKMDEDGKNGLPLPVEVKVLKARLGTKGSVYYSFLPRYSYFEDLEKPPVMPTAWRSPSSKNKDDASKGGTILGRV